LLIKITFLGGGFFIEIESTWFLQGIISSSLLDRDFKCDNTRYTIYSNLIKYMDWVLQNIDGVKIPQPENKNIGFITTTPKTLPKLCPNDAPDETFPFCCENGSKNRFCCLGKHINPTCSEPTTTTTMTTTTVLECSNRAPVHTYPYCCLNGAKNVYCCTGVYINPTCSNPTTTTPPPKCPNGASISTFPHCCLNGAKNKFCCKNEASNEFCCLGPYINPTCSAPTTTTRRTTTTTRRMTTPAPVCSNGAPSHTFPHCCENGAKNLYCCTGFHINPTCSAPAQLVKSVPKEESKIVKAARRLLNMEPWNKCGLNQIKIRLVQFA
jgi:hypothetical protein